MRVPERLISLVEDGVIDDVVRPLMSGKEAQVYLVVSGGEERIAKIYKDATQRLFKHRSEYTEGRRTRNSRDQRAMGKGSKHGRARDEASWHTAEVDMIYRLKDAGVRVPTPYAYLDGVLVMELVADAAGDPAPQLGTVEFGQKAALTVYGQLLQEVVRMLCAGVVHGDLSDYNVLMAADGPVLIDFPQAVDATSNPGARKLLLRDVDNLTRFAARFVTGLRRLPYGEEMWELYERGKLTPDTTLVGAYSAPKGPANVDAVLDEIDAAEREEWERRAGIEGGSSDRRGPAPPRRPGSPRRGGVPPRRDPPPPPRPRQEPPPARHEPAAGGGGAASAGSGAGRRRRRRRRRRT